MKERSLRLSTTVLSLAALTTLATGCIIVDDGGSNHTSYQTPPPTDTTPPEPSQVAIDPDVTIDAKPGGGVGFYVEYKSGGSWHLSSTCDTNISGAVCSFDTIVTPESGDRLVSAVGDSLEGGDAVTMYADGSVQLTTATDVDIDGVTFSASPGSSIQVDMALDGAQQAQFVFWYSGGVLHTGAPSDPIIFAPSSP